MNQSVSPIKAMLSHPKALTWAMNVWPPLLCTGVRVQHIADDYRHVRVKLAHSPLTSK